MAKKNSTWQCAGTTDSPHDPFDNFGPDCSVCGAKREDIQGSNSGKSKENNVSGPKPPIAAIAAGLVGGLAVLGVGYLLSPNIPGLCGVAQNCSAWQNDLTKAKRNINDAKAIVSNKSASEQEIKDAQKKADEAIKLLASLNQQESMKKDVKTPLDDAKQAQEKLITQLAAIGKPPGPKPTSTPKPTPTPTSGGTSKPPDEIPYSPPVREPEPPIARVKEPVYYRPEPEPEPVRTTPRYEPPAPQPESRPEPLIPR